MSGPASVTLLRGKARVLGAAIPARRRIIVREGKSLPVEAEGDSAFDLVLGAEAGVEEVVGDTIPESWKDGVTRVLSGPKPFTVMIVGDIDCGKTTFSTYLINHALSSKLKTAIIDADLGQSDIGPPTTMGLSLVKEPITELFSLEADWIFFAGATNPSRITERVIQGLGELKRRIGEVRADLTVVNTDGWVRGEDAVSYKVRMAKELSPGFIVGIQQADELKGLLASVEGEGFEVLRLTSSSALRRRDREERRRLREQGYRKFLGEPSIRLLPKDWVRLEYTSLGAGGPPPPGRREGLEEAFGRGLLYCEEAPNSLFLVFGERTDVHEEAFGRAAELLGKRVYGVRKGHEEGLLVGLLNKDREFLGLGVIHDIDYEGGVLRVYTSHKGGIDIVQFGQVKVNRYGQELGVTDAFSP